MKAQLKGIIFDLDGTLVDSKLDFPSMKRELGFDLKSNILEEIEKVPPGEERDRLWEIVHRHEYMGLQKAALYDGVLAFLKLLDDNRIHKAILTRNCKDVALKSLAKFDLQFDPILGREDVRLAKPHPEGLFTICRQWGVKTSEVVFVGDYLDDLMAGKNAGIKTMLFHSRPDSHQFSDHAHALFDSFVHLRSEFHNYRDQLGFI